MGGCSCNELLTLMLLVANLANLHTIKIAFMILYHIQKNTPYRKHNENFCFFNMWVTKLPQLPILNKMCIRDTVAYSEVYSLQKA